MLSLERKATFISNHKMMRKRISNYILFMLLGGFSFQLTAQQAGLIANYDLVSSIQNPAYNGLNRELRLDAISRVQWSNFPGTPTYTGLAFQAPLNKQFALGAGFQNLSVGQFRYASPLSMGSYTVDLAYHAQLGKNVFLSTGLRTGAFTFNMRISQLIASQSGDLAKAGNDYSFTSPQVGGGVMLYGKQYFFGISMPQYAITPDRIVENVNLGYNARSYYLLTAGYIHDLGDYFQVKSTIQGRMYEGLPAVLDANLYLIYDDLLNLGYGYRSTGSHAFLGNVRINDYFHVVYCYEWGKVYDDQTPFNSTEFGLRYKLNFDKQKTKVVPRHF